MLKYPVTVFPLHCLCIPLRWLVWAKTTSHTTSWKGWRHNLSCLHIQWASFAWSLLPLVGSQAFPQLVLSSFRAIVHWIQMHGNPLHFVSQLGQTNVCRYRQSFFYDKMVPVIQVESSSEPLLTVGEVEKVYQSSKDSQSRRPRVSPNVQYLIFLFKKKK